MSASNLYQNLKTSAYQPKAGKRLAQAVSEGSSRGLAPPKAASEEFGRSAYRGFNRIINPIPNKNTRNKPTEAENTTNTALSPDSPTLEQLSSLPPPSYKNIYSCQPSSPGAAGSPPDKRGIGLLYSFRYVTGQMAKIELDNIMVKTAVGPLTAPIVLDVTFTATEPLPHSLAWKVIYVGSAFSEDYDQILEEVEIEPIEEPSALTFELECPPPDFSALPREEIICTEVGNAGTTAMIVCGSYHEQQFIRVGYYIHNTYLGEEEADKLEISDVVAQAERTIIIEKPRITKFYINWGEEESETQRIARERQGEVVEKESGDPSAEGVRKFVVNNQVTEGQEKGLQEVSWVAVSEGRQDKHSGMGQKAE